MKQKLLWIAAACILLCALAACGKTDHDVTLPASDTPPQAQSERRDAPELSGPEDTRPVESAPPEESSTTEPVKSEEPAPSQTGWSSMLTAYTDILEELYQTYEDPERFLYEDGPSFTLYDVDLDGTEELIVRDASWIRIYGYRDAGKVHIELEEFPDLCCYDNGVIEAGWSHNQGAAGDKLWPYTVYRYHSETDAYEQLAMVDGWDKSLREVMDGKAFPDDVDQDGDGFVYYVITEEGGYAPTYGTAMDAAAYETWRDSYLNGAFPAGPSFLPLVKENIEALGQ